MPPTALAKQPAGQLFIRKTWYSYACFNCYHIIISNIWFILIKVFRFPIRDNGFVMNRKGSESNRQQADSASRRFRLLNFS